MKITLMNSFEQLDWQETTRFKTDCQSKNLGFHAATASWFGEQKVLKYLLDEKGNHLQDTNLRGELVWLQKSAISA